MPFELSRRAVTIGMGGLALTSGTAFGLPAREAVDSWRAACLVTELAWIDEAAAIERIAARGVDNPNDRYHEAALGYWRLAEAIGARRRNVILERARHRYPAHLYPGLLARAEAAQDEHCARTREAVAGYEARQARWKELSAEEDMAGHAARICAAESAEDALAADLLGRPVDDDGIRELQRQVARRIADTPPLTSEKACITFAELIGDGLPGAAVNDGITAAIIVRRLEALGYSLPMGHDVMLYDWQSQPESIDMRRRRGRLIACARSVPDIVTQARRFRHDMRFEEADWWMGPRPKCIIA